MEHRWSLRKPYRCPVVLSSPAHGSISARMRDIGLGGVFVETDGSALPVNTLVTVQFLLGGLPQEFRLHALVVRRAATGIGIMFLEAATEVVTALRRALYEETPVSADPAHAALAAQGYASVRDGGASQALNG